MEKLNKILPILLLLAVSSANALQCYTCDSTTDPTCAFNQNSPAKLQECAAGVTECYVSLRDKEANIVIRGCKTTANTICDEHGCDVCTEDQCNGQQFFEETCIACESNVENTNCEWNVAANNVPIVCPATTADRSGCYLQVKDKHYTRGCVSQLEAIELANCQAGEYCKTCQGNNCNAKEEFQRCYTCDSSADKNCVYRPDGAYIKTCAKYDDTCTTFAIANGKTGRGCSADVDSESTYCPGTNCDVCLGVECNSQLVPSTRITCYQCNDDQFGCTHDQEMFQSFLRGCETFNFQDKCYSYMDEASNKFYRGCMSDNSVQSRVCTETPEKCTVCEGRNCNSLALVKESTLTCHECKGDDCLADTPIPQAKCKSLVGPNDEETCYYTKLVGGDIQMGCTLDDAAVCTKNDCVTCEGDNCNSIYTPTTNELVCHQCWDDAACPWRQSETTEPIYCTSKLLHGEVDSCYHYRYANGTYRRGCLKDDRYFCYGHDCKLCTGNNCNSVTEGQLCIQCDSSKPEFATCGEDARELNAMPCEFPSFLEDIGCYSVKHENGIVNRGCWNEITAEHKARCTEQDYTDKRCVHCIGAGCNTEDHSGSANLLVTLPLLVLGTMIAFIAQ